MKKVFLILVMVLVGLGVNGQDSHIWKILTEDGTEISSFGRNSHSGIYYLQELGSKKWIKVKHIYGCWEFDFPNGVELVEENKVPKEKVAKKVENDVPDANYGILKLKKDVAQQEFEDKVYDVVEEMPSFVGGNSALIDYIKNNLRYPLVAKENGVQGRVLVSFVVEKDGSLSGVKVVRSVDPSLEKEAKRLVEAMPKWNAGKQNGSCVRVRYNVPISFRLAEELKTETKPKVYKNYDVTALNKEIEELRMELVKKNALK